MKGKETAVPGANPTRAHTDAIVTTTRTIHRADYITPSGGSDDFYARDDANDSTGKFKANEIFDTTPPQAIISAA